ncbi:pyridoxamine 5'-phosphate oxidase [Pseudozobellia thermophila]|uniref:Pyridoxine/pyridoxamine 5'-phosphate oxidase n=1 Tax=Pseudozobellia thermophila TaxID=192903 RepID=A0A1M6GSC2_9FLAO|nr:pyridoxamine 5'-phosphate oxidase [Pseudozobellia thermophila]SHJ12832.1 Pyridoxamine 5'-phosphate oxidase [Pseudozobellia thermophila]
MQRDLGEYRKTYQKSELTEEGIPDDPMQLFQKWFDETEASNSIEEPNAMTVSTIGVDGYPKSRIVLLKKLTGEGFVFYTNYNSEKGRAIAQNPNVGISFFWPSMERQVIVKGRARKVDPSTSDAYFNSRPEGSKLGALASDQSSVIPSREYLEERLARLADQFEGKEIERPEHWGGYIVRPMSVEFWQGRPNRLHDRILYTRLESEDWSKERLAP